MREPKARLAAIKLVKWTGNIEELREDPAFEWILKALNGDGFQSCPQNTKNTLFFFQALHTRVVPAEGEK